MEKAMKKKGIVLIVAVLVLIAAITCVGMRIINRGTDIAGVTTLYEEDTAARVIMNAKPGKEFYAGSGKLAVGEDKHIHVEYALDAGSLDLAFYKGDGALDAIQSADLDHLPESGDVFWKRFYTLSRPITLYHKPLVFQ